ncbi:hypothetical protein LWI29_035627 [Acer saccharum]|uniref:CCHC-type domain-containing protein n=1 Tax=Acer saccharum TaxID=4024 RepID=A0AA39TZA7_ACESA|nr:hypothetical protein LWI29_035627 [Acer saccharum]
MKSIWNLMEAVNLATRFEQQLLRSANRNSSFWLSRGGSSSVANRVTPSKSAESSFQAQKEHVVKHLTIDKIGKQTQAPPPPRNNSYAKPFPQHCYRCHQPGHRSNECPTRRTVNLIEGNDDGTFDQEDDMRNDEFDGAEFVQGDDGEQLVCILQKILLSKQENNSQRNSIFRTRCTINRKVCDRR